LPALIDCDMNILASYVSGCTGALISLIRI
jgi:hypothetical protein